MQKVFTMKAERIAHDGAAEGLYEGGAVRVHGMLPGEKEIIAGSPSRKNPEETHYLSCSPWQIADYALQIALKNEILVSLWGYYDNAPKPTFVPADKFYGYRTKVEFSFTDRDGDRELPLSLAFHERGGGSRRLALEKGCALVSDGMNRVALALCEMLREEVYTTKELKTLVVRESKSTGKLLA